MTSDPTHRGQCQWCKEFHLEEDLTAVGQNYRLCPTCHAEFMETQP